MTLRCAIGPHSLLGLSSEERRGIQERRGIELYSRLFVVSRDLSHSFLGMKKDDLAERTQYTDSGWHCIKALQEVRKTIWGQDS